MSDMLVDMPENEFPGSPSWLRIWFGVRDEVPRHFYAASGLGLAVFKYAVEFAVIKALVGKFLMPWGFLNPLLRSRTALIEPGPEWLGWALFVWTLPFVWIAFSMSVRRAANAGLSPWVGMLVLVPLLNLVVMTCLAMLPQAKKNHWQPGAVSDIRDTTSHHSGLQGLIALAGGLLIGLLMFWLSVYVLDTYGEALFIGSPLVMGSVTGFLYNCPRSQSWGATNRLSLLLTLAAGGILLLFALEGFICIVMAAPFVIPMGHFGGLIGKAIADSTGISTLHTFLAMLVLPLLAGMESIRATAPVYVVLTSVEVEAPPEDVWPHVVEFPDLPEPQEWYFRTGIASPTRARIEGHGVGAVRYCEFTTGTFVEPITVWDEPRQLAFDVTEQPEPMRELSPYRHVHPPHMEHQSLRSLRGEFRLVPLDNGGTRIEGRTWYTFEMFPQNYWTLWSHLCIHRIHVRVLDHIKQLAESSKDDRSIRPISSDR